MPKLPFRIVDDATFYRRPGAYIATDAPRRPRIGPIPSHLPAHAYRTSGPTQGQVLAIVLSLLAGGVLLNWILGGG